LQVPTPRGESEKFQRRLDNGDWTDGRTADGARHELNGDLYPSKPHLLEPHHQLRANQPPLRCQRHRSHHCRSGYFERGVYMPYTDTQEYFSQAVEDLRLKASVTPSGILRSIAQHRVMVVEIWNGAFHDIERKRHICH